MSAIQRFHYTYIYIYKCSLAGRTEGGGVFVPIICASRRVVFTVLPYIESLYSRFYLADQGGPEGEFSGVSRKPKRSDVSRQIRILDRQINKFSEFIIQV